MTIHRIKGPHADVPAALADDWKTLKAVPNDDDGCVICGAGGTNVFIGDTPPESVTWRCQGCNGLVCHNHTLCLPDGKNLGPHYDGIEYYHETMCSLQCWERLGKPDE